MNWILTKTKINEKDFNNVEIKLGIIFPQDFKEIVLKYNGGSPMKTSFDTEDTKERVAEYLLSFSEQDKYNILFTYDLIKNRLQQKLIPVMQDPFGNYICYDFSDKNDSKLFFWNHENNRLEYITKSFSDFLNSLYE